MKGSYSSSEVRWRLVLGRYAQTKLTVTLDSRQQRIERALDFLYSREYRGRGVRREGLARREGTLDPTQLAVPTWLREVRELFPRETVERIEKHALDRYEMTELVTDPETLQRLEPSMDLLRALLTFRSQMDQRVLDEVRRVIRRVVDEIRRKLESEIRNALTGTLNRFRRSPLRVARNLDWRGTIRENLKNYDTNRRKILLKNVRFFSRVQRRMPWHIVLVVDQSGSMVDSIVHSAVLAGILAGLPLVTVRLIVFDTSIVDLSEQVDDPVEVLMSVQLGGGTDIGQAMCYAEQLVEYPRRTAIVLITDFCEGAAPHKLLACCKRLREGGVTLLGLAALTEQGEPVFDRHMAERLAGIGMEIAALTPGQLARWLADVMH